MEIPFEVFFHHVKEKHVYLMWAEDRGIKGPHYFVCLKLTAKDVLIMSCCTSKRNTVEKFVESRKLPRETMVFITPTDSENPFTEDTYVNCNECHFFTLTEFEAKYKSRQIKPKNKISDSAYKEILTGILKSPLIDTETKDLLSTCLDASD